MESTPAPKGAAAAAPAPPPPAVPAAPRAPALAAGRADEVGSTLRRARAEAGRLPGPLRALALLVLAVASAAEPVLRLPWRVAVPFFRAGRYLATRLAPWALWAASKYIQWHVLSALTKIERGFKWAIWLLGLLPAAAQPPSAAPAAPAPAGRKAQ